jgi:DNA repair photolyase
LGWYQYQLDPYTGCEHRCLYCYTQNDCAVDWDTEVGIPAGFEARLAQELDQIAAQTIYMGMSTDPYQPIEARYGLTRRALVELARRGFSVSVLTKSDLAVRDLALIRRMSQASVGVSLAFQDEDTRRIFETSTISNIDRIRTLGRYKQQRVSTYALICPVFPFISDVEALIRQVGSCAQTFWIYRLEIKSDCDRNWKRIQPLIQRRFPEIQREFTSVVFSPEHGYWKDLRLRLEDLGSRRGLDLRIHI